MRTTVHKLFWIWQLPKEEAWINEMAEHGYGLVSAGKITFEYEDIESGQYKYKEMMLKGSFDSKKVRDFLKFMEEMKCGFSYTGYEFADKDATPMGKVVRVPSKITYRKALRNTTIFTSTVIFDTEIVPKEELVFPDIKSEDTALWFKLLRKGYKACGLDENFVLYRRTGNSLSSDKSDAARRIWNLYRISEGLPFLYSCFCFIGWGFNAVRRRI